MRSSRLAFNRLETRELAARAICKLRRLPEDAIIDGRPLWECFVPEVDVVLKAVGWEPRLEETSSWDRK